MWDLRINRTALSTCPNRCQPWPPELKHRAAADRSHPPTAAAHLTPAPVLDLQSRTDVVRLHPRIVRSGKEGRQGPHLVPRVVRRRLHHLDVSHGAQVCRNPPTGSKKKDRVRQGQQPWPSEKPSGFVTQALLNGGCGSSLWPVQAPKKPSFVHELNRTDFWRAEPWVQRLQAMSSARGSAVCSCCFLLARPCPAVMLDVVETSVGAPWAAAKHPVQHGIAPTHVAVPSAVACAAVPVRHPGGG